MTENEDKPVEKAAGKPVEKAADKGAEQAEEKPVEKGFKADFRRRVAENKPTRWVRFAIVMLVYILWVAWMGNWWLLLGALLLFDIYITGYIPFTWWKKSKNKVTRSIMSWVDAIVYALILVYFVFAFLGQNYEIPSSSLEKTLLTGDYLFVNKTVYGPRVPMTPINFPLVHNKMPFGLGKSYSEAVQQPYHRLKGQRSVEAGDIVVFNFPAGDTVMTMMENPDYYQLVNIYGYDNVNNSPQQFGKKVWRPVDRRENYVKRAVGLPGQRIRISDGVVYIDGQKFLTPANVQFNYFYQTKGGALTDEEFDELGIAVDDRNLVQISESDKSGLLALGFRVNPDGSVPPLYVSPLTADMVKKMESSDRFQMVMKQVPEPETMLSLFPESISADWTRAEYGGPNGLWIPKKGSVLKMSQRAWDIYGRVIRVYENNPTAEFHDGKLWIDGKPQDTYRFKMDYYFMLGDNRDCSLDSRYWGFVPEDHIVGTPWRVLISFDKDKPLFGGGIRWNRIFKDANPDK
ncbi:MAG: signal peptidase I [Muribaculaceae bacterium]|nr:signal peptidase I [Muribaculaceae bacterium]